mgnify:CR=1 FL=1
MELTELIISMLLAAFAFVLGWLIGVERNNRLCKELSHWKAYVKELELKDQRSLKQE